MSLTETINNDIKTAMLAREQGKLLALRSIKAALLLAATAEGSGGDVSEDAGMKILQKLAKQRKDSLEIYEAQKREDLAAKERDELKVIESYLPGQMSEAEVKAVLQQIIQDNGFKSIKETGKIMPLAMQKLAGKTDGKTISTVLKTLLEA
jgi:uncharacterized protein YqeY